MILFFVRFEATDAADITGRLYTLRTAAVGLNLDRAESPKNIHKMGTYYGAGRKKKRPTDNVQNDNFWKEFYMKPQWMCGFQTYDQPSRIRQETKGTHNGGLGL